MAVYVVSDIHGYYDLFLEGLKKVGFSDNDFLWCLGDAIDRGPDGIKVLFHIMNHENMDLLIGNHEFMFLNSVDMSAKVLCDGIDADLWLYGNSGVVTFGQYEKLQHTDRSQLLEWLGKRYVTKAVNIDDNAYCLTHSYYNPKCENRRYGELSYSDVWNITWSSIWRDDLLTHAADIYPNYDYTFICGHVPVQRIDRSINNEDENILTSYHHENVINIDGGAAIGPRMGINSGLIFLKLDDMTEYSVLNK